MKKLILMSTLALSIFAMTSCSKDDLSDITVTEAEALAGGSWKVVYYYDNGDGVSNDFNGYTFEFNDDGTLTATTGGTTFTGTWFVENSDDDPAYDKEMKIAITGNEQMDDLDGSWLIAELTDNVMKFKDDTPSEEIHFEKI
jgi:hypothetical protein